MKVRVTQRIGRGTYVHYTDDLDNLILWRMIEIGIAIAIVLLFIRFGAPMIIAGVVAIAPFAAVLSKRK